MIVCDVAFMRERSSSLCCCLGTELLEVDLCSEYIWQFVCFLEYALFSILQSSVSIRFHLYGYVDVNVWGTLRL